ncbi:hypothetical protein [Actinoplanes sp. GCM10030250]|uniref:hypothetical protein n=1 Tax=Actinoplanes sp. GCM10030250 TaxID=3273376 RepID=UPI00360ADC73
MIPQLVTVRHRRRDGSWLRLFVPVVPVLLVLLPLLVSAAFVACLIFKVSLTGALRGASGLLRALPGTRLDIEDDHFGLKIHIR